MEHSDTMLSAVERHFPRRGNAVKALAMVSWAAQKACNMRIFRKLTGGAWVKDEKGNWSPR